MRAFRISEPCLLLTPSYESAFSGILPHSMRPALVLTFHVVGALPCLCRVQLAKPLHGTIQQRDLCRTHGAAVL